MLYVLLAACALLCERARHRAVMQALLACHGLYLCDQQLLLLLLSLLLSLLLLAVGLLVDGKKWHEVQHKQSVDTP
jgi:hypothetical protein